MPWKSPKSACGGRGAFSKAEKPPKSEVEKVDFVINNSIKLTASSNRRRFRRFPTAKRTFKVSKPRATAPWRRWGENTNLQ